AAGRARIEPLAAQADCSVRGVLSAREPERHYSPVREAAMSRRAFSDLLGLPGERRLPARVRAAIRAEQDRSEILIGWMQIGVLARSALLSATSPRTSSRDMTFEPVPWVLGAYAAFTLVRLGLAYRTRLPGWFLTLSVVIDIALLLGLIWSFHLQYMQPAS